MRESSSLLPIRVSFEDFVDLQSRLVLMPRIEEEGVGAVVTSHIEGIADTQNKREDENVLQKDLQQDTEELERDAPSSSFVPDQRVDDIDVHQDVHHNHSTNSNDTDNNDIDNNNVEQIQTKSNQTNALNKNDTENKNEDAKNNLAPQQSSEIKLIINTPDTTHDKSNQWEAEHPKNQQYASSPKKITHTRQQNQMLSTSPETISLTDDDEDIQHPDQHSHSLIGKVLLGMEGKIDTDDWLNKNFTDILTKIRHADPPLVLIFQDPPQNDQTSYTTDSDQSDIQHQIETDNRFENQTGTETQNQTQNQTEILTPTTKPVVKNFTKWSSWAAEAASSAKNYASAVAIQAKETAAAVKEARVAQAKAREQEQEEDNLNAECKMYLPTSGDFEHLSKRSSLTTSSIILIRKSPEEQCPPSYHYQWYRSCGNDSWESLQGATYAAYQPTAIDVGFRLKCVVDPSQDDTELIICKTPNIVRADLSMFNTAREALTRGGQFSNLLGVAKAEGRMFRIQIEFSRHRTSAVTIYQLSGGTAEPIHPEPILGASAVSCSSNQKQFQLSFKQEFPGSMLELLSGCGKFTLQTPNRLTRETLLLALGIANFKGLPADLDCSTILYPSESSPQPSTPGKTSKSLEESSFFSSPDSRSQSSSECSSYENDHTYALEAEVQQLLSKMKRKDKVISDLQRQLSHQADQHERTKKDLTSHQNQLKKRVEEKHETQTSLRKAERRIETLNETIRRMKNDHEAHSSSLENQIYLQASRIAELEKSQKSLQNEKAVLNTAVEIRESKLAKMSELQASLDMLSSKVTKSEALKTEFVEMSTKYGDLCRDLEELAASEKECRSQLAIADRRMDEFNREVQSNRQKRQKCQVELMQIQAKTQTLMSERNAYKQKADSLTKEISRLCKNGLSIVDIERIIADENARRTEIEILKTQKRQALEDLNEYRTAYQQQLVSSLKAGVQGESLKAMQQNAELERVVADLTEYVTAKEMQMETLKQVNETLSQELKLLAHANMSKDEI